MAESTPVPRLFIVQQNDKLNLAPLDQFAPYENRITLFDRSLFPDSCNDYINNNETRVIDELMTFNPEVDYLVPTGDLALVTWVAANLSAIVLEECLASRFKLLKWDRQQHRYYPISVNIA